jgi:hypothetical protein
MALPDPDSYNLYEKMEEIIEKKFKIVIKKEKI